MLRHGKLANVQLRERQQTRTASEQAPFAAIAVNAASLDLTIDDTHVRGGEIDVDVSTQNGPSFDVALRTSVVDVDRSGRLAFAGHGAPDPVDNALHEDRICRLDARVHIGPGAVLARRLRLYGSADLDAAPGTRPACALAAEDARRVELELRMAKIAMDGSGLRASSGQVRGRAPLRLVNRFLTLPALTGWVEADLAHEWQRDRQKLPTVHGTLRGSQIALGVYRLASTLSAQVAVDENVVRVPMARVGFADGNVQIHGAEVRPFDEGVPLRAHQIDIQGLQFPGLMRDLGVTDHTHVRMVFDDGRFTKVEGRLDPVHIDSQLVTHLRDFEVFDSAFDDPARKHVIGVSKATVHAKFAVRPNAVEFQNARAAFGQSHLNVFTSLGFANEFRLSVSEGSALHLQDVSPLVDIPWKGDARITADITGVFNDPTIDGSVAIDAFEFADMAFGDLQGARVHFRPMVLELLNVRATKGASAYQVPWMRLDFTGPAPVVADATLRTPRFNVRDFLAVFHFDSDPRFLDIHGLADAQATLHYELGGPLDRCGGGWLGVRARGAIRSAELFEERYDSGAFDLDYEW
ncbi:MAG: hypothetical protein MUF54_16800, partial [Polyangiaceae bacterium]|nr:hypothetical protein [Polyangiaceae bacterium]